MLADLISEQGDFSQAITQARRALGIREQQPDPEARATSHSNLASYLERSGTPAALAEAPHHQLAGLIYFLLSGFHQHVQTVMGNYAVYFRHAHAAGTEPEIPRLTELLANPAFAALEQWLRQRQVPLDALQAQIDQVLEQARQAALASP